MFDQYTGLINCCVICNCSSLNDFNIFFDWAQEQNAQWSDYFRLVNTNRAVQHIQQGKISPWILLGCSAGKKMLNSFTDEQLQMTQRFINPEYWANKFKSYPADRLFVQETAKETKIE